MKKHILPLVLAVCVLFLGSCGGSYHRMGQAYENAKFLQTLNADAREFGPVTGLSGGAAAIVMEKYENSFKMKKGKGNETVNVIKLR